MHPVYSRVAGLDVLVSFKAIELIEQLEHRALHLVETHKSYDFDCLPQVVRVNILHLVKGRALPE